MKNYKLLVPIALVILFVVGIYMKYDSNAKLQKEYDTYLTQARKFAEKGITQDAETNYLAARDVLPSIDLYLEIGKFYKSISINDAIAWGEEFVEIYAEDVESYEYLLNLYIEMQDYEEFYDLFSEVSRRGLANNKILRMEEKINNKFYLEGSYEDAGTFSNGYCPVLKKGVWKYITTSGSSMSGYKFVEVGQFVGDVVPVTDQLGNKYLIDGTGKKKQIYEDIENIVQVGTYYEGVCTIYDGKSWNFYTLDGKLLHGGYEDATIFANGFASVKENGKWALVDAEGKKVSQNTYDEIVQDEKGIIIRSSRLFVKENDSYYLLNNEENKVVDTAFEDAHLFSDKTYAAVKIDGKWGFIDVEGKVVIKPEYEDARSFLNGYAAVKKDGKWGFIDMKNKVFIDFQFNDAKDFTSRGTAFVKIADEWRLLRLYSKN